MAYWESRVAAIRSHSALIWGKTKRVTATDGVAVTEQPVPAMELAQLHEAQRDLAAFAAASLRAGVDAAMVQLAQHQAAAIVTVLRAALTDPRVTVAPEVADLVIIEAVRAQALGG